jgi:serine/threonine protein kinase/WD40 repeat protein/tetratricopeptide (TPR) repeat protein
MEERTSADGPSARDARRLFGDGAFDSREVRLAEIYAECSDRLNAGESLDVDRVIASHPDLAPDLDVALRDLRGLASTLRSTPREAFGDFRLIRELGRGGMGIVYEAEQVSLRRRVALKVLPAAAFADERQVERFRREALAAARLNHRHIVPVFEVGEQDGTHYYAMQLIAGETANQVIGKLGRQGPGEPLSAARDRFRAAAGIALQAAEALAHAHGEGILHRDIKPANLLVDRAGDVWVADFGLAKAEGSERLTETRDIVGTFAYMAPERFSGWSDPRSDVYSLGLTLYELLAGRPAFADADSTRLMKRVADEEPPRLRKVDPRIPEDYETVVLRATAKEPGHRYQSAVQLAADLKALIEDRPIQARRVSQAERLHRWCRRNPALAALTTVAAVLALAVLVVSMVSSVKLQERLWESYLAQARAERWSRRPGQRLKSLESIGRAAAIRPEPALRDEAIAGLALLDLREIAAHQAPFPSSAAFGFDADLERYAVDPGDGTISIRRTATGEQVLHIRDADPARTSFEFSPCGTHLAANQLTHEDHPLKVWELRKGRAIIDLPEGGGAMAFSGDGGRVAAWRRDGTLLLHDLESRRPLNRWTLPPTPRRIRFDPAGRRLAAVFLYSDALRIIDLERGRVVREFPHANFPDRVAWSPDGERVACAAWSEITIWDVRSGEQRMVFRAHEDAVEFLAFNPAGDLLISSGFEGVTKLWRPFTNDLVLSQSGSAGGLSADGLRLGFQFASEKVLVAELAGGEECAVMPPGLHGNPRGSGGMDFSPEGRLLAYSSRAGIAVCDVARRIEVAFLDCGETNSVLFEPDGRGLVASGSFGLLRFPVVRVESAAGITDWIGHARTLLAASGIREAALFPDGRGVAVADFARGRVVLADQLAGEPRDLPGEQALSAHLAVSPDGRWVASGTWRGSGVKVWDAAGRGPPRDLAVPGNAGVVFSPDSGWLLTGTGREFRLWRAGTWEPGPVIAREGAGDVPGPAAFSPDGSLLAVAASRSRVELLDPRGLELLARLQGPLSPTLANLRFSPDGSTLAVQPESEREGIRFWDLHRIRARLAALGLDWERDRSGRRKALESAEAKARPAIHVHRLTAAALAQESPAAAGRSEIARGFRDEMRFLEEAVARGQVEADALKKLDDYREILGDELFSCAAIDAALARRETLIPLDASWRYFPGKADPSPGLQWTGLEFDDTAWATGTMPFDTQSTPGLELTDTTVYLRCAFTLPEPNLYRSYVLQLHVNDGIAVHLNGEEAGRLRAGPAGSSLDHQSTARSGATEFLLRLDPGRFIRGRNVLALQGIDRHEDDGMTFLAVLHADLVPDQERDRARLEGRLAKSGPDGELLAAYLEGRLLQQAGRGEPAIARFREAVARDSDSPEPLLRLGECLRGAGKAGEAEALIRRRLGSGRTSAALWDLWFSLSATELGKRGRDIAADLSGWERLDPRGRNLLWALQEVTAGRGLRINSGGKEYLDRQGRLWAADCFFSHGRAGSEGREVLGTEDGPLYQTVRYFDPVNVPAAYRVPVVPGAYRVTLHLAEVFIPEREARFFDVLLEGAPVIDGCEPRAAGMATASSRCFTVTVADGILDLEFRARSAAPAIAALEIEPAGGY